MRTFIMINRIALIVTTTLSTTALAGPEFDEGGKDAGPAAATAAVVSSSTTLAVTRVRGATSSTALIGAPDLVDMYLVKTGLNPYAFTFDMNMGSGGEPAWGARLTIFKKIVVNCGTISLSLVTHAVPVATVYNASSTQAYPVLRGEAPFAGSAVKLGDVLAANTEYFVAVSGRANRPVGMRDTCGSGAAKTLFLNETGPGMWQSNAEDFGYRLSSWLDPVGAETGGYFMVTNGVMALPASSCESAMPVVGSFAAPNFDFSFATAITAGAFSCPAAPINVTRQFFYVWAPNCTGSATVKTCGLTAADTGIEVYELSSCSNFDACTAAAGGTIACNDDCTPTSYGSLVTFPAVAGTNYLIRLTRVWDSGTVGKIEFGCTPTAFMTDINGDGVVNGADLALVLGAWGTSGN